MASRCIDQKSIFTKVMDPFLIIVLTNFVVKFMVVNNVGLETHPTDISLF